MEQPLLTIAIPTYNRASILDNSLSQLTSNPEFDKAKIEILVSDNASEDDTAAVVAKYPTVRYHRNDCNMGQANFTIALRLARGKYVRLLNDTATFRPFMLGKLLAMIESSDSEAENLFFTNPLVQCKQGDIRTSGAKELLNVLSYEITWSCNFGMWKSDFDRIEEPERFLDTLLTQVDWLLRCADNGKRTHLVIDNFWDVQSVKKKGSYNLFDTFINQYLKILRACGITGWAVEKEKYRLLRHFVLFWYFNLKSDREYLFDTNGAKKIMWRNYWYELYFYCLMAKGYLRYWKRK